MARYKFDQIAFNSTDKKKPVDEDKEHYIGLEQNLLSLMKLFHLKEPSRSEMTCESH